jgi:tetratricopeptide (TPR) repeat protein
LDDALFYFSRSLSLARHLGDRNTQTWVLNNVAVIYKDKGELDKALSYYEETLRLQTGEREKVASYEDVNFLGLRSYKRQ